MSQILGLNPEELCISI